MKILFIIEQPEIFEKIKDPNYVNPGVGGTTFTTLRMAELLKKSKTITTKKREIYLGILNGENGVFNEMPICNLKKNKTLWDVVVLTGGTIDLLYFKKFNIKCERKIAWLRHPYDWDKIQKSKKLGAEILSVGKAQFLTNFLITGNHHRINNIFNSKRIRKAADFDFENTLNKKFKKKTTLRVGYMGALIYSKGFHLLAKEWGNIKRIFKQKNIKVELHVIGGSSLYGLSEDHQILPCGRAYGELITQLLEGDISNIFFYGKLDQKRYKIMQNIDIAVANPLGQGEAFPATILEWISLGIPTIAPQSYGFGDVMNYLPQMVLKNISHLPNKIDYLFNLKRQEKIDLFHQNIVLSNMFSAEEELILAKWEFLLGIKNSEIKINGLLNRKIFFIAIKEYINMFLLYTIDKIKRKLSKIKKILNR